MFFYRPYRQIQNNGDSRFLVRTASDPGAMLREIKSTIASIDPNVPIGEDSTMTTALLNDFGPLRLTTDGPGVRRACSTDPERGWAL